ncbi:MAG TPA: hypothetical protein VK253_05205 [Candidatus Binatia bacterium]|nr:hypothetical protein [Candidatus Binatia bacterium]
MLGVAIGEGEGEGEAVGVGVGEFPDWIADNPITTLATNKANTIAITAITGTAFLIATIYPLDRLAIRYFS